MWSVDEQFLALVLAPLRLPATHLSVRAPGSYPEQVSDGGSVSAVRTALRLSSFVAPIRLRRRWRDCVVAALLFGLTVGVGLFALSGARRTQSSYDHFLTSVQSSDVSISREGFEPADNAVVAGLPGVISARTYVGVGVLIYVNGAPDPSQFSEGVASYDGAFFDRDRFVALHGRAPDPTRSDEIAVNEVAAQRYGYQVGQQLDLGLVGPPADLSHVTIVGIGLFPDEVTEDDADSTGRMLFTPAFTAGHLDAAFYNLQYLRFEHADSDLAAVQDHLRTVDEPGTVDIHHISLDRAHARRGLRPLSITLDIFGIIALCAGSALGAMALIRLQRREAHEADVLMSMGAPRSAVSVSSLIVPAVSLLAGCVVAIAVALSLSPFMPLGPAADLGGGEGVHVDVAVIGLGVLASALFCAALLVLAAWRSHRPRSRPTSHRQPSRLVGLAGSAGSSPSLETGVAMTLGDHGASGRVPMRSVITGTAISVATLVVALGFATNLHDLTQSPHAYGWNWDVSLRAGQGFGNLDPDHLESILSGDADIEAWSAAYLGDEQIGGTDVPLLGMAPTADVRPPIRSGRFIEEPDEIVLGSATAASLHAEIGDMVTIGSASPAEQLRVVGIGTLPSIGAQHVLHPSLGLGAIVAPERVPGNGDPASGAGPQLAFIRFHPGSADAALGRLEAITTPLGDVSELDILTAQRPSEIATAASLGDVPIVVAGMLAAAMALALGFALNASVRRRGHDLAVLRSLGFSDRQMTSTIACHSSTIVIVGIIVGVPVGVIGSPWLWQAFA
ncbi:MAG: hypothetical protein JWN99_2129, partial [Ilumatobacteraceae bacterium]|nr:hypothetical protein [Ilumatobacteraceae bacterium]